MTDKLTMTRSPYLVAPSRKPKEAIKFAMERGLFDKFKINKELIKSYLVSNCFIPIWIIEAACNINRNYTEIPVQYQYLWFCLHGVNVTRIQPSGRKFNSLVNFSPGYIKSNNKIRKLMVKACNLLNLTQEEFSLLCGYNKGTIRIYKNKISITVALKLSQILNFDVWKLLENYEFFGKTSKEGKIIIPRLKSNIEIGVILTWLRTEGHLELRSTHIEINQKNNKKSLEKLKKLILKSFSLKETEEYFPKGKRGEDRLIISSSPLRQLLCLKYDIPLGYKSGCLKRTNLDNYLEEDYKKLMAAFVQTEGCLSYVYTRNKKKKLPKFEFTVKDESLAKDCIFVLEKLKFKPIVYNKQNLFKIGMYDSKDVIKLINQIKPYIFNNNKINYLRSKCTHGIGI